MNCVHKEVVFLKTMFRFGFILTQSGIYRRIMMPRETVASYRPDDAVVQNGLFELLPDEELLPLQSLNIRTGHTTPF